MDNLLNVGKAALSSFLYGLMTAAGGFILFLQRLKLLQDYRRYLNSLLGTARTTEQLRGCTFGAMPTLPGLWHLPPYWPTTTFPKYQSSNQAKSDYFIRQEGPAYAQGLQDGVKLPRSGKLCNSSA